MGRDPDPRHLVRAQGRLGDQGRRPVRLARAQGRRGPRGRQQGYLHPVRSWLGEVEGVARWVVSCTDRGRCRPFVPPPGITKERLVVLLLNNTMCDISEST